MMKTDVSKYTYYLESQAVWPRSIKSTAQSEANSVSAISSAQQTFIGDDRENGTFFVRILSSTTSSSSLSLSKVQYFSKSSCCFEHMLQALAALNKKKKQKIILQYFLRSKYTEQKRQTLLEEYVLQTENSPKNLQKSRIFASLFYIRSV